MELDDLPGLIVPRIGAFGFSPLQVLEPNKLPLFSPKLVGRLQPLSDSGRDPLAFRVSRGDDQRRFASLREAT